MDDESQAQDAFEAQMSQCNVVFGDDDSDDEDGAESAAASKSEDHKEKQPPAPDKG